MSPDNRRKGEYRDRRAHTRGGRRETDHKSKPWYMRRRLWLATASLLYVGWRRITGRSKGGSDKAGGNDVAA